MIKMEELRRDALEDFKALVRATLFANRVRIQISRLEKTHRQGIYHMFISLI